MTPPSAVVALPPRRPLIVVYSSSLCLLGVWYPRRLLVALSPRRLFDIYSSSSPRRLLVVVALPPWRLLVALPPRRLLVVVALPPCIQPPCCLRPAVVVCSAQQSGPAVVALPPCIQPPCGLRPAAVLPAPSSQARRRAQQSRATSPYLRPAVRHAVALLCRSAAYILQSPSALLLGYILQSLLGCSRPAPLPPSAAVPSTADVAFRLSASSRHQPPCYLACYPAGYSLLSHPSVALHISHSGLFISLALLSTWPTLPPSRHSLRSFRPLSQRG